MHPSRPMRTGFTLIELMVVLVVLAVLAGMVVAIIDDMQISTPNGEKSPQEIATEMKLRQIQLAILGDGKNPGAWADLGQRPELLAVFANPNTLLLEYPPLGLPVSLQTFDPLAKIGWRGPYLMGGNPLTDGWGNPLVMQVDFDNNSVVEPMEARYARVVSSGPDGVLQTPLSLNDMIPGAVASTHLTLEECGDDLVLFLRAADVRQ